jgi:hypothetical protein
MANGNVVIKVQPLQIRLGPLGFHRYASEFLRAADSFECGDGFSPVPYYLRCRVIELALKAFLLAKRFSKNDLKHKLGHNLEKALNSATKYGLQSEVAIKPKEEEEIKKGNVYYADKGFEYFQVTKAVRGYPMLPDLKILADVSSRLVSGLKDVCMKAA